MSKNKNERMDADDFLKKAEQKIRFYSRYARLNRALELGTQTLILILAAITPIFAAIEIQSVGEASSALNSSSSITFTLISSSILAILEGVSRLFRFRNLWLRYRKTSNLLKNEYRRYQNKVGEYKDSTNALPKFKVNFEKIIETEQTDWFNSMQRN